MDVVSPPGTAELVLPCEELSIKCDSCFCLGVASNPLRRRVHTQPNKENIPRIKHLYGRKTSKWQLKEPAQYKEIQASCRKTSFVSPQASSFARMLHVLVALSGGPIRQV